MFAVRISSPPLSLHISDVLLFVGVLFQWILVLVYFFFFQEGGGRSFYFQPPGYSLKNCNRYEKPESRLVRFCVTTSSGVVPHLWPPEQVQHQALGNCSGITLQLHIPLQTKGGHDAKYYGDTNTQTITFIQGSNSKPACLESLRQLWWQAALKTRRQYPSLVQC